MALTDEVAQHILGKLFELTKSIEVQEDRILHTKEVLVAVIHSMNDTDKKIIQSKTDLLSSLETTKAIHAAHVADLLVASEKQMEAVSAERLDAFIKGSASTSQAVIADIVQNAEAVKQAVVKGVGEEAIRLVRDRVSRENTTLSEASRSFVETGGKFANLYVEREGRINAQIIKFGEALDKIIDKKTPSKWGSFLIAIAANAVTVGCIALFIHFFVK